LKLTLWGLILKIKLISVSFCAFRGSV